MAEEHGGLRGPNARAQAHRGRPGHTPHRSPPLPYDGLYPSRVPYDRTDRRNLRARRRAPMRPLVLALITWLALMAFLVLPAAAVFWSVGGFPPSQNSPDDKYWDWTGSPEDGRDAAIATVVLGGAVAIIVAGSVLFRTVKDRQEMLQIDSARIREGIRSVAVPPEVDLGHDWFGRRRRRAIAETPTPRAHDHHPVRHHPD